MISLPLDAHRILCVGMGVQAWYGEFLSPWTFLDIIFVLSGLHIYDTTSNIAQVTETSLQSSWEALMAICIKISTGLNWSIFSKGSSLLRCCSVCSSTLISLRVFVLCFCYIAGQERPYIFLLSLWSGYSDICLCWTYHVWAPD